MTRLVVLLSIVVLAAAAPARAWCEATCLKPGSSTSHCPTHDPATTTAQISSSAVEECPAVESARPTVPARFDVYAAASPVFTPPLDRPAGGSPAFVRPRSATSVFERSTPLRI